MSYTHIQKSLEINGAAFTADLVETSPETVVSQDLSKNSDGIARVYAFAENTELGIEYRNDSFVLALHGSAEYQIEDTSGVINSGEMMKLSANRTIMIRAKSSFKLLHIG